MMRFSKSLSQHAFPQLNWNRSAAVLLVVMGVLLASCRSRDQDVSADSRPQVLTTFTVLADLARNVAGDRLQVASIVKPGAEIHGYQPTPSDIERASKADLIVENGLGLELWAQRFTAAAGDVPQSFEELEALPGVGHKTASVVMAQAFGVPAFPVDTHIHRLAQRWGLSDGSSVARTEQDLKRLFPKEHWNRLHLQIIFWGREFCTARGCDGTVCPMCRELYPKRRRPVITRKP